MILGYALTDKVTVIPTEAGTVNEFNDAETKAGTPVEIPAYVVPLASEENVSGDDQLTTSYTVYTRPSDALTGVSWLEWDGRRYNVIGAPKSFRGLSGGAHHFETVIRRTDG